MPKQRKLTFISTFAGMGGFDLAFHRAGAKCLAQIECDPQCLSVLRRHFPKTKHFKDIRDFNRASIAVRPDVIVGGFPCQDLSVAGRRAGLSGERSGLFFEFMRIVAEFAPGGVLIENVPGLLSGCGCPLCRVVADRLREHLERERKNNPMARDCGCSECRVGQELHKAHSGRNFSIVLAALAKLGYGVAMRILDAQWFGVPQRRERVFIVGYSGARVRSACEVLFERESLPWDSPPRREAGTRTAAGLTRSSANGGGVRNAGRRREDDVNFVPELAYAVSAGQGGSKFGSGRHNQDTFVCGPLQAHAKEYGHAMTTQQAVESGHVVAAPLDTKPYADHEAKESRLVVEVDGRESKNQNGIGIGDSGDVIYTLQAGQQHGVAHTLRSEGHDASEDGTGRGIPLVPVYAIQERASATKETSGPQGAGIQADVAYTLEARHHVQAVAFDTTQITSGENCCNPQAGDPCHPLASGAHAPAIAFNYQSGGSKDFMRPNEYSTSALGTTQTPAVAYQCQGSNVGPLGTLKGQNRTAGVPFTFQPRIARNGRGRPDEVAPALTGSEAGDTCDSRPCVVTTMAVRRLTPKECERLQGFPDEWSRYGIVKGELIELSDSARYRMLGNAVEVDVAEWLAVRMVAVHRQSSRTTATGEAIVTSNSAVRSGC